MSRFLQILQIAIVFLIGGLFLLLAGTTNITEVKQPENTQIAEQTPKEMPETKTRESTTTEAIAPESQVAAPVQPSMPRASSPNDPLFAQANAAARAATVNIFCEMESSRSVKTITGSGVLIDRRGVILTNAHIAQFFLLNDYPKKGATECIIRTGNPAHTSYTAKLLYIPITWIQANADEIANARPTGTGEHDYALLYITGTVESGGNLPDEFPILPVDLSEEVAAKDEQLLITSYPALVSEVEEVENSLYLVSALAITDRLFTFDSMNRLDLFGLSGNILAQHGSSGGAVVDADGYLVGIVVTSTKKDLVLERQLRALTPAYINRNLIEENGTSIQQLLYGDLRLRAQAFNLTTAPILEQLLVHVLDS